MSKWIDNENPDAPPVAPQTKTIYLAQIAWREPGDTQDTCKTIKSNSPEDLREQVAHYRFLRGALERFQVDAWSESLRLSDGHWKIDEKHDLAVRA